MKSQGQKRIRFACRWGSYAFLLIIALCLQTMPGLFTIGLAKPVYVLPLCLAVALFEGEYAGAWFGLLGGLMWDYTAGRTAGLLALSLMVLCSVSAVVVRYGLQRNPRNFIMISGLCTLIQLSADFFLFYCLFGYPLAGLRYTTAILPSTVFSALLAPLSFYAARAVYNKWQEPTE